MDQICYERSFIVIQTDIQSYFNASVENMWVWNQNEPLIRFQGAFNFLKLYRTFNVGPKCPHAIRMTSKFPRAAYSLEIFNRWLLVKLFLGWKHDLLSMCIKNVLHSTILITTKCGITIVMLPTQITFFPLKYRRRIRLKMQNCWRKRGLFGVREPDTNVYWLRCENFSLVFEIV